jgi:uncharacterized protein YhaN
MKLTKLHLYGFGRFQDTQIELSKEPIHIFLGNNEAGKSTLMAFIRCILFGFPTKQQSELRYEPRLGGRYGGNIVIETKEYGTVTVERVHGKATGDAKVYFSNGNIGGEAELKLLLSEIDRTTFSGIYSFGLTDLQTIEQLHADELNKFMYGVGISGRNNLLEIEKKNEKLIQVLYKPTGRKPVINEQLKKVVDLEEKVSSWRRKLSQHENLVKQHTAIVELIEKASRDELVVNRDYRYFEKLQSIAPVFLNKMIYESRLEQLPLYQPFPEDGLQRLEKFSDSSVVFEGELIAIEKKLNDIYSEKAKLRVNENVNELEEAISQVKESRKIYETKRDEKALLLQQIEYEEQEYEVIKEKVGDKEATFETSFVAQQKLTNLIKKEVEIKQQGFFLQSQFEQVKTSLEDKENQVEMIKRQLLDGETKKQLEETLAKHDTEKDLQQQLKYVEDGLQMVNRQLSQFVSRQSSFKTLLLVVALLLSLFCAFILFKNSQMLLAVSVVIGTFIIVGYTKLEAKNTVNKVLRDLKKQQETFTYQRQEIMVEIEKRQKNLGNNDYELLQKDQQIREQLFFREQSLDEVNEQYELVCKELDKWEFTNAFFQEELRNWATEFNYPLDLEAEYYDKLLKMMEEIKKKQRQLSYLKQKLASLESEIRQYENQVENLCLELGVVFNRHSFFQNVEQLSLYLKSQQEVEKLLNRLTDQENQLLETKLTVETKLNQYKKEVNLLFQLANVRTEEEFRQKGKAWLESQHIHEQLRIFNSQIAPLVSSEAELKQLERDILEYKDCIAEKLTDLKKQESEIRNHLKTLQGQLAKLNQEIIELEEGTSYSISLHNYENEKGNLNREVKRWALHRTVQLLIDETKQVYEKQRQPHVIREATRMFHSMTNGEYVQLYAPIGEQRLFVERSDGLKFQPNELSQGTREQLYFAIRLSLATVHSKLAPFPIFIDDILVNFDKSRRLNAIELIKEMSKQHQIVFFTCHPFMANEISENHYCLN